MYTIKESLTGGIINDTWLAEENGISIIVQKVNTDVFRQPEEVMHNMVRVTEHLQRKLVQEGRNPKRETLTFLKNESGSYLTYRDEGVFRKSLYIPDCYTRLKPGTGKEMQEAGRLYGDFLRLLSDFQADTLFETLPGFHDTEKRMRRFLDAADRDMVLRKKEVLNEIEILKSYEPLSVYYKDSALPLRVTHNDTKIANLLFDKDTKKALAVIDLETVMEGYSVFDFGDAIRSGACGGAEDDPNPEHIFLDWELYQAFREGYLSGAAGTLSEQEIAELDHGVAVIIYEQALRFLTDYLEGDTYYKTAYPEHNLIRARNQIRLLQSFLKG